MRALNQFHQMCLRVEPAREANTSPRLRRLLSVFSGETWGSTLPLDSMTSGATI